MKQLLLLILLCFASIALSAQEFYGGVLGGFNGSQIDGDFTSGYHKMGLVGGVWIQRDLSRNIYWGMEIKFNQKGARVMPTNKNENRKYVYRLNYIDLPVLVGFRYENFSFFGGLSYAYLINKNGYDNFGYDPVVQNDDITDWEVGFLGGMKIDFDHINRQYWARNLMLELRFQYSLVSIDKRHDFFWIPYSVGQFNNVISTVLYYRIDWAGMNR
jgi:hypothetical protein